MRVLWLAPTLCAVIWSAYLYNVWNNVVVPAELPAEDVWKAKAFNFVCWMIHSLRHAMRLFNLDPNMLGKPLPAFLLTSLRVPTEWPLTVERIQMAGVPVVHYKYNHQVFDPQGHAVIIYFHGGGWQWLRAESAGPTLKVIAERLKISVLSVDYRLAPEHPYPAGLNDCLSVTNYVLDHFKQLNVNPDKVIVAGDSAGGNLAAAVSLKFKKKLRLQVLIYPLMQAFDFQTPSYRENAETLKDVINVRVLTRCVVEYLGLSAEAHALLLDNKHICKATRNKYSSYVHSQLISHLNITKMNSIDENNIKYSTNIQLVKEIERLVVDPSFSPLMSNSLDDLTHAYVITAQHDVLRDDGLLYHSRLERARGVHSTLVNYQQGFHGFFQFAKGPTAVGVARQAVNDLVEFIQHHVL